MTIVHTFVTFKGPDVRYVDLQYLKMENKFANLLISKSFFDTSFNSIWWYAWVRSIFENFSPTEIFVKISHFGKWILINFQNRINCDSIATYHHITILLGTTGAGTLEVAQSLRATCCIFFSCWSLFSPFSILGRIAKVKLRALRDLHCPWESTEP